jgi:hypothetical protein
MNLTPEEKKKRVEYNKKWRKENPEKSKEQRKRYKEAHPEKWKKYHGQRSIKRKPKPIPDVDLLISSSPLDYMKRKLNRNGNKRTIF